MTKKLSRPALLILLINIAVMLFPSNASSDGIYIPEKAYKKLPTIPTQHAIIVYRDGKETLIIESALSGEGKNFGWILPLPSVPDKIDKVSTGTLKTMTFLIQPKIIHDLSQWFILPVSLLIIVLLGLVCFVSSEKGGLFRFLVYLFLVAIVVAMLLPSLSKARSGISHWGAKYETDAKVEILKQVMAGIYDIAVIKAEKASDIYDWLDKNGFGRLDKGEEIVSDYIKKGWCFAAARISRDLTEGISTPHPVSMEFATNEPFYPLRLTALAGSDVGLELFVIAKNEVVSRSLKKEFCDIFVVKKDERAKIYGEIGKTCHGEKTKTIIGHPALMELMWSGCVLTKLENKLKPKMMEKDIYLKFKDAVPYQQVFFSRKGALYGSKLAILYIMIAGLIVTVIYFKIRYKHGIGLYFKKMLIPLLGIAILCGGLFYISVRKVEVRTLSGGFARHYGYYSYPYYSPEFMKICDILSKEYNTKRVSLSDFRQIIKELFEKEAGTNPFLGGEIIEEDSPGNYIVRDEGDKFIIDVYDAFGRITGFEIIKKSNVTISVKHSGTPFKIGVPYKVEWEIKACDEIDKTYLHWTTYNPNLGVEHNYPGVIQSGKAGIYSDEIRLDEEKEKDMTRLKYDVVAIVDGEIFSTEESSIYKNLNEARSVKDIEKNKIPRLDKRPTGIVYLNPDMLPVCIKANESNIIRWEIRGGNKVERTGLRWAYLDDLKNGNEINDVENYSYKSIEQSGGPGEYSVEVIVNETKKCAVMLFVYAVVDGVTYSHGPRPIDIIPTYEKEKKISF